jgi:hypothetical protein
MSLDYSVLPAAWFGGKNTECDIFDIFTTSDQPTTDGKDLGRFKSGAWSALIPPHGSRFFILSNCT